MVCVGVLLSAAVFARNARVVTTNPLDFVSLIRSIAVRICDVSIGARMANVTHAYWALMESTGHRFCGGCVSLKLLPRARQLRSPTRIRGTTWIAVYDILEEVGLEVYLVNAWDMKNLPGRKSDVQESQWLMKLHSYGLLRNSFRPSPEIRIMRIRLHPAISERSQLVGIAFASQNGLDDGCPVAPLTSLNRSRLRGVWKG